ncbi:MAG: ApeP family dehydratase [Oceanococcus sp.]
MSHIPQFPCVAETYLPHAAPMALLDDILACDENSILGRVFISENTMFCGPNGVPNWVGIEYMAQAIAAWGGVQAQRRGEKVKIGFLVSTRRMLCALDHYPVGANLEIGAHAVSVADNGLATFDCHIKLDGEDIVSARINVFQPADPHAFLAGEVA